nr:MAG TPA: tRNA ribose 2'-O-methyltransferase, aTrm56 [Caudoviricetes sp.]
MSKIVQIAFDVPDDIYEGLMNGTLSNFGSVVRDSKGIVAHLKQADLPLQEVKEGAKALVKNKKLMIVGGAVLLVTGAVAGGVTIANSVKKKKVEKRTPLVIKEFNTAFGEYLDAINKSKLDDTVISNLISKIEALQSATEQGEIEMDYSSDQVKAFIKLITNYTKQLAKANDYSVRNRKVKDKSPILELNNCLNIQKDIFDKVA